MQAVSLTNGPYDYSQSSFINNTIKDFRKIHTSSLTNASLPVFVQPGSKFDIRLPLAGDYFFLPSTLEVSLIAQLFIKEDNGVFRKIEAKDGIVPTDGLNFVKNIRPQFDNFNVIPPSKECNQKLYNRIINLVTKSNDEETKKRSIEQNLKFFETEKLSDNKSALTHSHKYTSTGIEFSASTDTTFSQQNSTLAQSLTDEFVCQLDFSNIAPLDVAKIHSRPVENLLLSLEVSMLTV